MTDVMFNGLAATALIAMILAGLKAQELAVKTRLVTGPFSRKLVHVALGIFLLLGWSLYRDTADARWWATLVPVMLLLYFVLLGLGVVSGETVLKAGSRTGDRGEFLRGPAYYMLSFAVLTAVFWRTSPVGIAALMVLVLGDGLGEVAGKSIPGPRIPWNRSKSLGGSSAVLLGGWAGATAVTALFTALGFLTGHWQDNLMPLLLVATAGAAIESLPLAELDNLTIPAVCAVVGQLVLA